MDWQRKNLMGRTFDAHVAEFFDRDAAGDEMSKRLLALKSFTAPAFTLARRETDTVMEDNKYTVAYESKQAMDTTST